MSKRKKLTTILISIILVIVCVVAGVVVFAKRNEYDINYIAHRGHGYYENTEEAFYNSKSFWGIECDVWITSDNQFILNHGSTVTYDDGSSLKISSSTNEQLLSGTVGGGYKLCSLSKYLQICNELSKVAVIEIKPEMSTEEISLLIGEIEENYSIDHVMIISFSADNLLKVKEQSTISLQYLINDDVNSSMDFCINNKINPSFTWGRVDVVNIKKAHKHNLKVGVWTVNDKVANTYMKSLGVDYITSDVFYQ